MPAAARPAAGAVADAALLQAVQAATSLVKAHRMHGHLAARLDPLGSEPVGDPALEPATVGLNEELMRRIPASVLRVAVPGDTFADALPKLRETYTGTIAYEIEHISDHEQRVWLRRPSSPAPTASRSRPTPGGACSSGCPRSRRSRTTCTRPSWARSSSRSRASTRSCRCSTRRSSSAADGAREVVLGMAHRGRLNVLAHTVGRPYAAILAEFEGEQTLAVDTAAPEGGTGDVKYHYGASGTYRPRRAAASRSRSPTRATSST